MIFKQLIFILIVQLACIVLYSTLTQINTNDFIAPNSLSLPSFDSTYPMFQDIHVMIFIGFGFLMVFLRNHQLSSLTYNFLIAALSVQVSILFIGIWENIFDENAGEIFGQKFKVTLISLISGDFAAGAVLISFGAVLGKLNSFQLCIMAVCETFLYAMNSSLGAHKIKAVDAGGSIFVHAFGAFFGLGVSKVITKQQAFDNQKNKSNANSNLIAMIGTLFLWMYWPSFNGALASGSIRHTIVVNTTFSIISSCIASFIFSPLFNKGKYDMEHLLNATLAGGVIIGTNADLTQQPGYAIIIGFIGGTFSVFGFATLNAYFERQIKLHDTCGVNFLHGMPGVMAGCISTIFVATSGLQYNERTGDSQAGFQLIGLAVTVAIALTGGALTGLLLSCPCFEQPLKGQEMFQDEKYFDCFERGSIGQFVSLNKSQYMQ